MARAADRHRLARFAFAAVASLYVGCLIVQVFVVGLDIFADTGASTTATSPVTEVRGRRAKNAEMSAQPQQDWRSRLGSEFPNMS